MYMHEIALVVAVATPVVVVVTMNLYLAIKGDSADLLLPRLRTYPSQPVEVPAKPAFAEVAYGQAEPEPLRKAA